MTKLIEKKIRAYITSEVDVQIDEDIEGLVVIPYDDVKEAVLELIEHKRKLLFSQEQLEQEKADLDKGEIEGLPKHYHNLEIKDDIALIKEIFGDNWE